MKILIDENLPIKLKNKINGYEIFTVRDMKWNGLKNGELLRTAINEHFDVFITTDKNIQYQQNIDKLNIALIVLDVKLLKWDFVQPLIPKILKTLSNIKKNNVYIIN